MNLRGLIQYLIDGSEDNTNALRVNAIFLFKVALITSIEINTITPKPKMIPRSLVRFPDHLCYKK
jgi:hypothetical protein